LLLSRELWTFILAMNFKRLWRMGECDGLSTFDSWRMSCMGAVRVPFSRAHMTHTTTQSVQTAAHSVAAGWRKQVNPSHRNQSNLVLAPKITLVQNVDPLLGGGGLCHLFSANRLSFPRLERPVSDINHSTASSAEVMNEWSYAYSPHYAFVE
jgi:hypothetical protein